MTLIPEGPGLTLRNVSIAFLVLTWFIVVTRFTIRSKKKCLGADDWSMAGGLFLYTILCVTTIASPYYGVGAKDDRLTPELNQEGRKWFLIFQLFYVAGTVPIKASICIMLLRITPFTIYQRILYCIIAFSTLSAIIVDIALLAWCKPVSATWNPSAGKCGDVSVISSLGFFISASTIVTDWSCSILPIFILWNARMRWRVKVSVGAILALGVLASTANLVRLQYVLAYQNKADYLNGIANIAVWSIIESGTGIVAGSMPAMAPLIRHIPVIGAGFVISDGAQHTIDFGTTNREQLNITTQQTVQTSQARTIIGSHDSTTLTTSKTGSDVITTRVA